jgi:hypothetical protein
MKDQTSDRVAVMFKIPAELKATLKARAKQESKQRGYPVKMSTLFVEWIAGMRQSQ